jgi:NAD(P)-dependent dehydrogenase (short-subunit alcohol dehydrogenase family)
MSATKNVSGKKIKEFFASAFEDDTEYTLDETKKQATTAFKDALKSGQGKKRVVKVDSDGVVMKKHPGKRLTTPDDVGHAIVALSAPGMSWVTGNTITIDGGEQIAGG